MRPRGDRCPRDSSPSCWARVDLLMDHCEDVARDHPYLRVFQVRQLVIQIWNLKYGIEEHDERWY